ncbi:MAG: STAS domain-containing protein [Pseudomonadales bacterium]
MAAKTSFSCGVSLDVTAATALQSRLQKALKKSSTIELKVDAVEKADTAGLQLLLALAREVGDVGGRLIWKKPSKVLIDAACLLGIDQELGLS